MREAEAELGCGCIVIAGYILFWIAIVNVAIYFVAKYW